jgi:hypothetical protein
VLRQLQGTDMNDLIFFSMVILIPIILGYQFYQRKQAKEKAINAPLYDKQPVTAIFQRRRRLAIYYGVLPMGILMCATAGYMMFHRGKDLPYFGIILLAVLFVFSIVAILFVCYMFRCPVCGTLNMIREGNRSYLDLDPDVCKTCKIPLK